MSFGTQNMSNYIIHQENEALSVVSHLNEMSIIDITRQDFMQRFDFNIILPINNLPGLIEQAFKQTEEMYPESIQDLEDRKNSLYRSILNSISMNCGVTIDPVDDNNLYAYTYYIYDFMISNFKQYLITFFTNFILKEKNNIYTDMELSRYKKQKNSTTKYGKGLYSNPKLVIISAYLNLVIQNMMTFDISLETILNTVYNDRAISASLLGIHANVDFFNEQYCSLIQAPLISQSIISNIRLSLHNASI